MYFILLFTWYRCLLRYFLTSVLCVDLSIFILPCGLLFSRQHSLRYSANTCCACSLGAQLTSKFDRLKKMFTDYLKLSCLLSGVVIYTTNKWDKFIYSTYTTCSPSSLLPTPRKKMKLRKTSNIMTLCAIG